MTDREIFRNNFSELMRITKVKQIDVARYAQVSYQTVSAWATGRGYPRPDAMERICRFFGIKQSALTEEKNEITDENKLLMVYRSLSATGKQKAFERMEELVKLYPKRSEKVETEAEK